MKKRKVIMLIAAAAVAAIFLAVYGSLDPAQHFFPRCPFRMLTGYDCPGCGSQRAIHSLLTGDLRGAIGHNALFVAALPLLALLFVASAMRTRRPSLYNVLNSRAAALTVLVVVLAWWLLRNIL